LDKPSPSDSISPVDIDLAVYDFDGVMTDNRVLVQEDGREAVFANRADGWGVGAIDRMGIRQLILSTEANPVVRARAAKLKLEVIDSSADKLESLAEFCRRESIEMERVLYVGNDVNDLEVMKRVKYPVAPADAHPEILKIARFVTRAMGGEGVIKEISEKVIVP